MVLARPCLHNTYFSFQKKFYEQGEGAPMGSPVGPIVANLYMEHFEEKPSGLLQILPGYGICL